MKAAEQSRSGRGPRCSRILASALCLLLSRLACGGIDIDIRGVDDELRNNVLAYLSLARYTDRTLDPEVIERLHNRIDLEVKQALRPFGYYEPTVSSSVTQRQKNDWLAVIQIDPGPPVLMERVDVHVSGPGAADPRFRRIVEHPTLAPGERLRHAAYDRMKQDLLRTASTYGYLDARMIRSELRVDTARRRASAILEMETGPRYRFGLTTIEQNVVKDSLARRYLRYRAGDPFDLSELLRTQFALDDSQYFSNVEVQPGEPDRINHTVPIAIRALPNRRDRYAFSVGYGTDTGPRGTVQWDRHWINASGDRLTMQAEASARLQLLQAIYSVPIGDPAVEKAALTASADYGTPGDLIDKDFALGPSLTRVVDRFQYVLAILPTHAITTDANGTQSQTLIVPSLTVAAVPRGYLGEALFTQTLIAQLRGGQPLGGGGQGFMQAHLQAERVIGIAPRWHLLLRGELGTTLAPHLSDVPGFLRFFAGGDQSVRGFAYDDLSPVVPQLGANGMPLLDKNGHEVLLKIGGRSVITGTVEFVRDLPHNLGVAVFSDFGNAFDSFGHPPNPAYPHFIEYSVGTGVRWRLPVVTLGIDIAQPLSRNAGPRLHINFSPML